MNKKKKELSSHKTHLLLLRIILLLVLRFLLVVFRLLVLLFRKIIEREWEDGEWSIVAEKKKMKSPVALTSILG